MSALLLACVIIFLSCCLVNMEWTYMDLKYDEKLTVLAKVIASCTNEDELETCKTWVNKTSYFKSDEVLYNSCIKLIHKSSFLFADEIKHFGVTHDINKQLDLITSIRQSRHLQNQS